MQLSDLTSAIQRVTTTPLLLDLRAAAYCITYPHIRGHISRAGVLSQPDLLQLATMTYGWMPRVLRVDTAHLAVAVVALNAGVQASATSYRNVQVGDLASCIRSVVGASKMLHFVNDTVFPIWDSRIEAFRRRLRQQAEPTNAHMSEPSNYIAYVDEVHAIRGEPGFQVFYSDFQRAYSARQHAMGVAPYAISEVRAIEAAAFELA